MAFFDKVSSIAKNAADKTGDMIEITRLNSKINAEEEVIQNLFAKLGEQSWKKFEAGETLDEAAVALCSSIKDCKARVEAINAEIAGIKSGSKQMPDEKCAQPVDSGVKCPACGAVSAAGTKFCGSCGAKLSA